MPDRPLRDEASRLAALAEYGVLDTPPEPAFERIVDIVRHVVEAPMATVTFIDAERQWFKARRGMANCETARREAICDHTARQVDPLVLPDLTCDARFAGMPFITEDPPILAYLGCPLISPEGYGLGAVCALDHRPRPFTAAQIAVMQDLAALVVDWLEMRRIAQVDFLTGATSRRGFLAEAEREIARHYRHGRPCAVAVFDVDHFKSVNDRFGHGGGDEVLKSIAAAAQWALREGDILGRLGGEEFALLLPETDGEEAFQVAERLRTAIGELGYACCAELTVTASFGVAEFADSHGDADHWIETADRALYRAKESGRNRTIIAG